MHFLAFYLENFQSLMPKLTGNYPQITHRSPKSINVFFFQKMGKSVGLMPSIRLGTFSRPVTG